MNTVEELDSKTKFIKEYTNELNNFIVGKTDEDFKKLDITPLEQHLMSIQLMSLTSAMIAMNDRLMVLRSKNSASKPIVAEPVIEPQVEV